MNDRSESSTSYASLLGQRRKSRLQFVVAEGIRPLITHYLMQKGSVEGREYPKSPFKRRDRVAAGPPSKGD